MIATTIIIILSIAACVLLLAMQNSRIKDLEKKQFDYVYSRTLANEVRDVLHHDLDTEFKQYELKLHNYFDMLARSEKKVRELEGSYVFGSPMVPTPSGVVVKEGMAPTTDDRRFLNVETGEMRITNTTPPTLEIPKVDITFPDTLKVSDIRTAREDIDSIMAELKQNAKESVKIAELVDAPQKVKKSKAGRRKPAKT